MNVSRVRITTQVSYRVELSCHRDSTNNRVQQQKVLWAKEAIQKSYMEFTDHDYSAGHSLFQRGAHLCRQYKCVLQLLPEHIHKEMHFHLETLNMTQTFLNALCS